MAINRVQFQPGLSLPAFLQRYGTESACSEALQQARWPQGFVCPRCAGTAHSRFERQSETLWQCAACRHQTSLLADTLFAYMNRPGI